MAPKASWSHRGDSQTARVQFSRQEAGELRPKPYLKILECPRLASTFDHSLFGRTDD